jgi:hypothetical protein
MEKITPQAPPTPLVENSVSQPGLENSFAEQADDIETRISSAYDEEIGLWEELEGRRRRNPFHL